MSDSKIQKKTLVFIACAALSAAYLLAPATLVASLPATLRLPFQLFGLVSTVFAFSEATRTTLSVLRTGLTSRKALN